MRTDYIIWASLQLDRTAPFIRLLEHVAPPVCITPYVPMVLSSWNFNNGSGCSGVASPTVGPGGTVYVATGGLAALDPASGLPRWRIDLTAYCPPVIGSDGTVYVLTG